MDSDTGWCEGCLRTLEEIASWGSLDDAQRQVVLERLPERRLRWHALQAGTAVATAAARRPD